MKPIVVLGVFVADTTFTAERQPKMGETVLGDNFALGPGGKGSNQAVCAGKLGGNVQMITRLGDDDFAEIAMSTWHDAGVKPEAIITPESYTGAACIFIEKTTGDNAIIVSPGAARLITPADIEAKGALIKSAGIFITQLEQPEDAAQHALRMAKDAGVTTILNPAPACALPNAMLACCDYITPNESEAEALTGIAVNDIDSANAAAKALLDRGVGTAIITLGEQGALLHDGQTGHHIAAFDAGPVAETTGAGDAFNGGFATALSAGLTPVEAARFGCAVAGISVTRPGAAHSMPTRDEAEQLFGAKLPPG